MLAKMHKRKFHLRSKIYSLRYVGTMFSKMCYHIAIKRLSLIHIYRRKRRDDFLWCDGSGKHFRNLVSAGSRRGICLRRRVLKWRNRAQQQLSLIHISFLSYAGRGLWIKRVYEGRGKWTSGRKIFSLQQVLSCEFGLCRRSPWQRSVSYTHLDVYKRQVLGICENCSEMFCPWSWGRRISFIVSHSCIWKILPPANENCGFPIRCNS